MLAVKGRVFVEGQGVGGDMLRPQRQSLLKCVLPDGGGLVGDGVDEVQADVGETAGAGLVDGTMDVRDRMSASQKGQ
jgi:hypothetical protein